MDLTERAAKSFEESIQVKVAAIETLPPLITETAVRLWQALLAQNKLLICGNGGSAAAAQAMAGAFVNRLEMERPGLPALALTTDSSIITSVANDYRFDEVFARQVSALGQPGDVLIAITTSGRSPSITAAIAAAHERAMAVVLLNGRDGGPAADQLSPGDLELRVPTWSTARVQEVHLTAIHCICELIDLQLSGQEN